ncbi:uncharacterized protein LOC110696954 [Chenopodium quinoa]|uniref:uncharacterized protein LOC110696954 n=1 Tax=Chenopodium quinoa TaxID=63459 RepID=UPI000B772A8C|nr:uncharacterized protein LOC110696954 [Chenopodium quinoa]
MNLTINVGTNLLYGEFPEHYRWDASTKEWKGRKNTLTVVGRILFVLPAEEDDDAASICLAEAAEVQLPGAFRRLFTTVLIFCQPSDPSALWGKYYTSLLEDFRYQFKDCTGKIKQLTVSLLEQHLESMGKSLKTFGLDHLSYNVSDEFRKTRDIADALNTAIPEEFINSKERLNAAQLKAFNCIMKHVNEGKGGAFLLMDQKISELVPAFCSFLLSYGKSELQTNECGYVQLPDGMIRHLDMEKDPILEIIKATFPEVEKETSTSDIFADREILTPMNDDADMVNSVLIDQFPGEKVVYKSFDVMLNDTCSIYPMEFINKLCLGGMSPHELVLKKDCPVILLRNIMPSEGLCNGTRLICKTFMPNIIVCEISVGQCKGKTDFVHRATLRPAANSRYPFTFERKQFPIKLCFAMTINKSQG